jgi:hypothetical protein
VTQIGTRSTASGPRALVLLTALILATGGLVPTHAVLPPTTTERVLVVTANLQEAYDGKDVSRTGDMDHFVARLVRDAPQAPDVLLLQEVRHSSALYVARKLTAVIGSAYAIAVDPGRRPVRHTSKKTYQHDTAILLNRDTMTAVNAGGFLPTGTKRWQMAPGRAPVVKYNAHLLAREKANGMVVPVMSVHLSPDYIFKRHRTAVAARNRWASKIAAFMATRYSGAPGRYFAVGGDFNGPRCPVSGGDNCRQSKFYSNLMERAYRDSVRDVVVVGGVDFIFTKTGVYDAGVDDGYNRKTARDYYSDHQFRWSVAGPDRLPPSAPTDLSGTSSNARVHLTWQPATDDGSGIDHYAIFRAGSKNHWRRIDVSPDPSYTDTTTYAGVDYDYKVRAVDRAHNTGPASTTEPVKAAK